MYIEKSIGWMSVASILLCAGIAGCAQQQQQPSATHVVRSGAPQVTTADALARSDAATATLGATLNGIAVAREVIAMNIANAQTTGYKRVTAKVKPDGGATIGIDLEQGSLERTDRPLDIAIEGDGFFAVKDERSPAGVAYTRNGSFFMNQNGRLVLGMGDGLALAQPIDVPTSSSDIKIDEDGTISVRRSGAAERAAIGQIAIYRFRDAFGLAPGSQPSLYQATTASGPAVVAKAGESGAVNLLQGFLEASNVNVNRERKRMEFLEDWKAAALGDGTQSKAR